MQELDTHAGRRQNLRSLRAALRNIAELGDRLEAVIRDEPARAAAAELRSAIHEALELASTESTEPTGTELFSMLHELEPALQSSLPDDVDLSVFEVSSDPVMLAGERTQTASIIRYVVSSVGKAMSEGGELTLAAGAISLARTLRAQPESMKPGDYGWISISDSGSSIDSGTARRFFEPGTARSEDEEHAFGGMLESLRDIDGGIRVASADQRGSRFELFVPISETRS